MGWDSNPRGALAPAGFQDRCLKPLGHPSGQCFQYISSTPIVTYLELSPKFSPCAIDRVPEAVVELFRRRVLRPARDVEACVNRDRDRAMPGPFLGNPHIDTSAQVIRVVPKAQLVGRDVDAGPLGEPGDFL